MVKQQLQPNEQTRPNKKTDDNPVNKGMHSFYTGQQTVALLSLPYEPKELPVVAWDMNNDPLWTLG